MNPPSGAAESLWLDLSDRLDATTQRRRRLFVMASPGMRFAFAAFAMIAVVGGVAYFLGSDQGLGAPPPPPSPTTQAQTTVPNDWTPYTSSRFAYSAEYPTTWDVTPATKDWTSPYVPDHGGVTQDVFGPRPFGVRVWVTSTPLTAGMGAAEWISAFDKENAALCNQTSNRHSITLDGVTVRQEDQLCGQDVNAIQVLGATNGYFYMINFVGYSPITPVDRATFDRFLASFRFSTVAVVTATDTGCTSSVIDGPVAAAGPATISVVNRASKSLLFAVAGAKPGHAFGELQTYFAAEHQRALNGESLEGYPTDIMFTVTESDVSSGGTTTLSLPTIAGTYGVTCVYLHGSQPLDAFLVGPIEIAP